MIDAHRIWARSFMGIVIVFMAIALSMLSSCGSSKRAVAVKQEQTVPERKPSKPARQDQANGRVDTSCDDLKSALVREAESWIGVPYKWGGDTRSGVDCSGFMARLYSDVADVNLPRTTLQQMEFCTSIDRDELRVGDMLFFSSTKSGGKVAHVGMYVGDNKMIHASSSRGVVKDDLGLKYYIDHFLAAGRLPSLASDPKSPRGENSIRQSSDVKVTKTEITPATPSAKPKEEPVKHDASANQNKTVSRDNTAGQGPNRRDVLQDSIDSQVDNVVRRAFGRSSK